MVATPGTGVLLSEDLPRKTHYTKASRGQAAKGGAIDAGIDIPHQRKITVTQSHIRVSSLQMRLPAGRMLHRKVAAFLGSQHRRVPGWIRGF